MNNNAAVLLEEQLNQSVWRWRTRLPRGLFVQRTGAQPAFALGKYQLKASLPIDEVGIAVSDEVVDHHELQNTAQ
jgi:hypothetical protein